MTARSYLVFDGGGAIASMIFCDDSEIEANTPAGMTATAGAYQVEGQSVDVSAATAKNDAVAAATTPEELAAAYDLTVVVNAA